MPDFTTSTNCIIAAKKVYELLGNKWESTYYETLFKAFIQERRNYHLITERINERYMLINVSADRIGGFPILLDKCKDGNWNKQKAIASRKEVLEILEKRELTYCLHLDFNYEDRFCHSVLKISDCIVDDNTSFSLAKNYFSIIKNIHNQLRGEYKADVYKKYIEVSFSNAGYYCKNVGTFLLLENKYPLLILRKHNIKTVSETNINRNLNGCDLDFCIVINFSTTGIQHKIVKKTLLPPDELDDAILFAGIHLNNIF